MFRYWVLFSYTLIILPGIWGAFDFENSRLKKKKAITQCNFFLLFSKPLFLPHLLCSFSWQYFCCCCVVFFPPQYPSSGLTEIANHYLIFLVKLSPFSCSNFNSNYVSYAEWENGWGFSECFSHFPFFELLHSVMFLLALFFDCIGSWGVLLENKPRFS